MIKTKWFKSDRFWSCMFCAVTFCSQYFSYADCFVGSSFVFWELTCCNMCTQIIINKNDYSIVLPYSNIFYVLILSLLFLLWFRAALNANLEELRDLPAAPEEIVTWRISFLLMCGVLFSTIAEGIKKFLDVSWSSRVIEQDHGGGARMRALHARYGKLLQTMRALCRTISIWTHPTLEDPKPPTH